ncbi:MAG: hypothetical protein Q8K63_13030 [Acidimicrobiales bacterium]|nr:hypothetical protein [Acidimicrobiales bacterium]
MARLTAEELAAFVEESCQRHGVPTKIEDPFTMQRVAALLRGQDDRMAAQRPAVAGAMVDRPTAKDDRASLLLRSPMP